jgi:agmatinase
MMIQRTAWWDLLKVGGSSGPADIGILGLPYDGGVCYRRGASEAPARLRALSKTSAAITESGTALEHLQVVDFGDVEVAAEIDTQPRLYFDSVAAALAAIAKPRFLLCLGGDHSTMIPVARWIQHSDTSSWGIVHIDAHPDLFSIYDQSPNSHACALRRTLELPNFHPKRCVLVGARSFSPFETEFIRTAEMPLITAKQFQAMGIAAAIESICDSLAGVQRVLISLDIDVADPAFAPGTGIPAAGGLTSRELLNLLAGLIQRLPVELLCLVEISPPLDTSDITSFLGIQLVMETFGSLEQLWYA